MQHMIARTLDFPEKEKVRVLPHSPYLRDLIPCDFFLFLKTKEEIRKQRFLSDEETIAAYNSPLSSIPKED